MPSTKELRRKKEHLASMLAGTKSRLRFKFLLFTDHSTRDSTNVIDLSTLHTNIFCRNMNYATEILELGIDPSKKSKQTKGEGDYSYENSSSHDFHSEEDFQSDDSLNSRNVSDKKKEGEVNS